MEYIVFKCFCVKCIKQEEVFKIWIQSYVVTHS